MAKVSIKIDKSFQSLHYLQKKIKKNVALLIAIPRFFYSVFPDIVVEILFFIIEEIITLGKTNVAFITNRSSHTDAFQQIASSTDVKHLDLWGNIFSFHNKTAISFL